MTDLLSKALRAEHKNLSFSRVKNEEIWRQPLINDSEAFTGVREAVEGVWLNRKL